MSGLEERLVRIEQKFGKDSKIAQGVRDQIAAEGTTARELYLTRTVPIVKERVRSNKKSKL